MEYDRVKLKKILVANFKRILYEKFINDQKASSPLEILFQGCHQLMYVFVIVDGSVTL